MTDRSPPQTAACGTEPEGPTPVGAKVLIVDDSVSVRETLANVLKSGALKADVDEASDGVEALKRAMEGGYDCVICDIHMPNLDGMSFLKQLRQHTSRLELPVIFLTVREKTRDKVAGFNAGASDFLVKPVEPEELVARVETQVRLARMHRETAKLTARLKVLVDTDPLCDIWNRRAFMRRLAEEFGRAQRKGWTLGLLLIDVDHFKRVNDSHGHQVGDKVLTEIARIFMHNARKYDTVARIGGEEFAVLLPEIKSGEATLIAERFRASIEERQPGGPKVKGVTISVGVGRGPLNTDDHPEALYRRADTELYAAKRAGRNRVSAPEL